MVHTRKVTLSTKMKQYFIWATKCKWQNRFDWFLDCSCFFFASFFIMYSMYAISSYVRFLQCVSTVQCVCVGTLTALKCHACKCRAVVFFLLCQAHNKVNATNACICDFSLSLAFVYSCDTFQHFTTDLKMAAVSKNKQCKRLKTKYAMHGKRTYK